MNEAIKFKSAEPAAQCALVVDDDPICQSIIGSVLVSGGYTVVLAASGREALSLAPKLDAAIAIIDLNMPDGNGLQTCAALRRNPKWLDVPIIVVTSYSIDQGLEAALRAGATGFLCKPFVPSELLEAATVHIGRRGTVKPGLRMVEEFDLRLRLDPADMAAESLLPPAELGWILR